MAEFITNLAFFIKQTYMCVYIQFANCEEVELLVGKPIGSDLDVITLIS